ncbi:hypothetical protein pipiens_019639, partial [Culex pipiens pipiens]
FYNLSISIIVILKFSINSVCWIRKMQFILSRNIPLHC